MKTTFYFLRHGDVANPKKILYGRLPRFSLSSEGKEKIIRAGKILQSEGLTHIYTSPLLRTRQTAEIIGKILNVKPTVSKLLTEVNLIFAGKTLDEYHTNIAASLYSKENIKAGQESIEAIGERMLRFLKYIISRHKGGKILVVSHGDPIMILRAVTTGEKFTYHYKKSNYLRTATWFTLECENNHYEWI